MPSSGSGDPTDDFFDDILSAPPAARPPPPQPPVGLPPTVASSSAPTPAVRSRRPPPPPGTKRTVGPSSGPRPAVSATSSSTMGLRKGVSSSAPAAPIGTCRQTPSYYLNNDATSTAATAATNNNHLSNRENINPASTTTMFYPHAAATSSATPYSTGSETGHSMDWYTPSMTSTMAPIPMAPTTATMMEPTIMNPYMPQPLGSMDVSHATDLHGGADDYANEPPLIEELGINVEHIVWKTRAVVLPFSRWVVRMRNRGMIHDDDDDHHPMSNPQAMVQDADLAGPIAFAVLLGAELLLAGKMQFGYIYGFGMFGCLSMTLILNLLQPQPDVTRLTSDPSIVPVPITTLGISFWSVTSVLGYSLLPVNGLAAFKLLLVNNPFWKLTTLLRTLAVITIAWSTIASTRLFEQGFGFRDQRYLIAYPIALLYSAFVLITIF